jgi:replicative DNA helicase
MRAIAQEEDIAMLTATQTNREGAKANVAKMEHTAEDFNRVRIADILISINRTEEEKARNEARLYLAASRNQKGDITIRIQQDLEKMIFIRKILGIE